MCIIVYKPKGKKLPKYETLKTCFENNNNGAGFMYVENGIVIIKKGYMCINDLVTALNKIQNPRHKNIKNILTFGFH
jgi:hypothetical protein